MPAGSTSLPEDIRVRMDRMYRPQKHIYDLTRKFYLLGRDRLIAGLDAGPGEKVLDVGCGTGRNLALIARRFPDVRLFGLDAAAPMLERAAAHVPAARLARGAAEELDPSAMFKVEGGFDHILVSYCLSMVDDPDAALRAALRSLNPGGTLHVVDFGDMADLPAWCRRTLTAWLARFQVRHRPEIEATLRTLAAEPDRHLATVHLPGRYALLLRLGPAGTA